MSGLDTSQLQVGEVRCLGVVSMSTVAKLAGAAHRPRSKLDSLRRHPHRYWNPRRIEGARLSKVNTSKLL